MLAYGEKLDQVRNAGCVAEDQNRGRRIGQLADDRRQFGYPRVVDLGLVAHLCCLRTSSHRVLPRLSGPDSRGTQHQVWPDATSGQFLSDGHGVASAPPGQRTIM